MYIIRTFTHCASRQHFALTGAVWHPAFLREIREPNNELRKEPNIVRDKTEIQAYHRASNVYYRPYI